MGLIATIIMEREVGTRWENVGDILSGDVGQLDYRTIPRNRLYEAHLLGAFNTMDPGNAPDTLPDALRIAGAGLPDGPRMYP